MNHATTPIEDAIREMRADIEHSRLELDAKVRSLKVLEGVLEKMKGKTVETTSSVMATEQTAQTPDGMIDLSELAGASQTKRTLIDDIRDVLPRFGAQEFNITHVEITLKRLGIEVTGKYPKSRISVSLVKLCDEGLLARTFTGSGSVPHRYRTRSTMTEAELDQALTNNPMHLAKDSEDESLI